MYSNLLLSGGVELAASPRDLDPSLVSGALSASTYGQFGLIFWENEWREHAPSEMEEAKKG